MIKQRVSELKTRVSPFLPGLFFALGFIFDILTLDKADDLFTLILQAFFLSVLSFQFILDFFAISPREGANKWLLKLYEYRNECFHFLLGSLLSAFTIFYFKSASLEVSFVFLLFMGSLLVLNEFQFFKRRGLALKSALLMLMFSTYVAAVIPLILGSSSSLTFYLSLFLCFSFSTGVVFYLHRKNFDQERVKKEILIPHISILVIFLFAYILKLLPPIPLTMEHMGVYYNVERNNGNYLITKAPKSFLPWKKNQFIPQNEGEPFYLFFRVFSPGGFKDRLNVELEIYDEKQGWRKSDSIPLSITGGRREGFRGFVKKQNYRPGKWRARVLTRGGLEVGRINFKVYPPEQGEKRLFETFDDLHL